jgi:hypothetical protein
VIQGEAGIMDMTGFPGSEPTRVGVAITDYLAGLYAIQGILLALLDRDPHRPRTARRHRALRRDAVGDAAAAVGAAGDRRGSDTGRERSPVDFTLRAAAREGRIADRGGRQPETLGAVLRRESNGEIFATIRATERTPIAWRTAPSSNASSKPISSSSRSMS